MTPEDVKIIVKNGQFGHPKDDLKLIKTKMSWIILAGEFAYKIKKPSNFGFADFSSLEKRKFYCEEEVRLNKRLAPDIYLQAVPICYDGEQVTLGKHDGYVFDYAVKMRRFSENDILPNWLKNKHAPPALWRELAQKIAQQHLNLPRLCATNPVLQNLPQQVADNYNELSSLIADSNDQASIAKIKAWSVGEFRSKRGRVKQRMQDGFFRECHGNLHLGNILYQDGHPFPFDCVEFSEQQRCIDLLSDIASTILDLDARYLNRQGNLFLNAYLEATGDYQGLELLRLYKVNRCITHARIALKASESVLEALNQQGESYKEFKHYLNLAEKYTSGAGRFIVVMHGVTGTGKSMVAEELVERYRAIRLRSDIERKRVFGLPIHARASEEEAKELYSEDGDDKTLRRLTELCQTVIHAGFPCIIDGSFLKFEHRKTLRELASSLDIPYLCISCEAGEKTIRRHLKRRMRDNPQPLDATIEVLHQQMENIEPMHAVEKEHWLTLNTEHAINWDKYQRQFKQYLGRSFSEPGYRSL